MSRSDFQYSAWVRGCRGDADAMTPAIDENCHLVGITYSGRFVARHHGLDFYADDRARELAGLAPRSACGTVYREWRTMNRVTSFFYGRSGYEYLLDGFNLAIERHVQRRRRKDMRGPYRTADQRFYNRIRAASGTFRTATWVRDGELVTLSPWAEYLIEWGVKAGLEDQIPRLKVDRRHWSHLHPVDVVRATMRSSLHGQSETQAPATPESQGR